MSADRERFSFRVLLGFLVAPIPPGLLFVLYALMMDGFSNLVTPFFVLLYYLIACYLVIALVALPLYLLLSRFLRLTFWRCLLAGFVVGGLVSLVPFLVELASGRSMYETYELGRDVLVTHGHFTAAGIRNGFWEAGETGLFGAAIALTFWLVVRFPQIKRRLSGQAASST